jgi:glycosyltransferase involved in cell wall biosynthesis
LRLRFVVPADVDAPTGGNVYDRAVADALRRTGDTVDLVRCEPQALGSALARRWTGFTLVDGLLASPQPEVVAGARVGVLVHMARALQTGLEPERADEIGQLERRALHAASPVIATSRWTAQYLARHHGLRSVAVAEPGVDPAAVMSGSDPPLLVHLSALLPHKDQLGVVAALSDVRDLPWRARLAGPVDRDAAYAASVHAAVVTAELTGRIEIPGAMPRRLAWAGADLALLPSLVEAYGMVVTEALARGIPAIVAAGGPAEALGLSPDGERPGVVVRPGDTAELARELRRWLTDEGHRARLRSTAASRRLSLPGWDTTARLIRSALLDA